MGFVSTGETDTEPTIALAAATTRTAVVPTSSARLCYMTSTSVPSLTRTSQRRSSTRVDVGTRGLQVARTNSCMGCEPRWWPKLPLQSGESGKDPTELRAGSWLDTGSGARLVDERETGLRSPEESSTVCSGTDTKAGSSVGFGGET